MLKTTGSSVASGSRVDDNKLKVVEVYANGFIRLSKSPAGALRQAGKAVQTYDLHPRDLLGYRQPSE